MNKRSNVKLLLCLSFILLCMIACVIYRAPHHLIYSGTVESEEHIGNENCERGNAEIQIDLEVRHYLFKPDMVRGEIIIDDQSFVNADEQEQNGTSISPPSIKTLRDKFVDKGYRSFRLASLSGTSNAIGSRYVQFDYLRIRILDDGVFIHIYERQPELRETIYRIVY